MGRNSKWIEGEPEDSTQRVARRALDARLERMCHYLERAVEEPKSETENVHQLRVFARRTASALEIFDAWLPQRRGKWVSKQVKSVRRAAGAARDLDVLQIRWSAWSERMFSGPAQLLLDHVHVCRREAQQPIEEVYDQLAAKRFARRTSRFLHRVRTRDEETARCESFGRMARTALGRLAGPFLTAARAEMIAAEALHAFRIQGKQVRYAMEIFGGAFDAEFRDELYPLVATLQERLGAINDHVTAQSYLARWNDEVESPSLRQAIELGIQHERHHFESCRQEFLAWWTAARREDLARRFADYVQFDTAINQPPRWEERAG
jgi:CHAD domain-containing protein